MVVLAVLTPFVLALGTSLPLVWWLPLALLLLGLEGRAYRRLAQTTVLLLEASGAWRLGGDPLPWQLVDRRIHPGLLRLRFVRPGATAPRQDLLLLRDQVAADDWRVLSAWLASARSLPARGTVPGR